MVLSVQYLIVQNQEIPSPSHVMMVIIYLALIHALVCQLVCGQEKIPLVKVSITANYIVIAIAYW